MAKPQSASQMASDYNEGVAGVTQQEYCDRQTRDLGVSPEVCASRFQRYSQKAPGKGQKMVERWQRA